MSESINDCLTAAITIISNITKCGSACKFGNAPYFAELLSALCTIMLKKKIQGIKTSMEYKYDNREPWYHRTVA